MLVPFKNSPNSLEIFTAIDIFTRAFQTYPTACFALPNPHSRYRFQHKMFCGDIAAAGSPDAPNTLAFYKIPSDTLGNDEMIPIGACVISPPKPEGGFHETAPAEYKKLLIGSIWRCGILGYWKLMLEVKGLSRFYEIAEEVMKSHWFVDYIAIHPRYQSRGHGSKLTLEIINHIKSNPSYKKGDPIILTTANLIALKVYQKCGFRILTKAKLSLSFSDGESDELHLLCWCEDEEIFAKYKKGFKELGYDEHTEIIPSFFYDETGTSLNISLILQVCGIGFLLSPLIILIVIIILIMRMLYLDRWDIPISSNDHKD